VPGGWRRRDVVDHIDQLWRAAYERGDDGLKFAAPTNAPARSGPSPRADGMRAIAEDEEAHAATLWQQTSFANVHERPAFDFAAPCDTDELGLQVDHHARRASALLSLDEAYSTSVLLSSLQDRIEAAQEEGASLAQAAGQLDYARSAAQISRKHSVAYVAGAESPPQCMSGARIQKEKL
jgi:hypothetical protein